MVYLQLLEGVIHVMVYLPKKKKKTNSWQFRPLNNALSKLETYPFFAYPFGPEISFFRKPTDTFVSFRVSNRVTKRARWDSIHP